MALNPNFQPLRGVPGLGFDYEHLAAVGSRAPLRQGKGMVGRRTGGFILPVFDLGLPYYYYPDTGTPYGLSEAPDVPPVMAEPPVQLAVPQPLDIADAQATNSRSSAEPKELSRLLLVRRDAQVLLTVAFTVSGGNLTYITPDGLRRSFPVADLDREATRQMNDVNGTSVAIPN